MPCGTSPCVEQSHAVLNSCRLPSTCPSAQTGVQTIAPVSCFWVLRSCLMVTLTLVCRDIGQDCAGDRDFALARFITLPTTKWHGREKSTLIIITSLPPRRGRIAYLNMLKNAFPNAGREALSFLCRKGASP